MRRKEVGTRVEKYTLFEESNTSGEMGVAQMSFVYATQQADSSEWLMEIVP